MAIDGASGASKSAHRREACLLFLTLPTFTSLGLTRVIPIRLFRTCFWSGLSCGISLYDRQYPSGHRVADFQLHLLMQFSEDFHTTTPPLLDALTAGFGPLIGVPAYSATRVFDGALFRAQESSPTD